MFLANHNYNWNGTETEWDIHNITVTLQAPGVVSVSLIEPSGPKPLDFQLVGSTLSFNVAVNGGIMILIETPDPISLLEFQNALFVIIYCLTLIVVLHRFIINKKRYFFRFLIH